MKQLKLTLLTSMLFFFVACEKSAKDVYLTHIDIAVLNQQGQNLIGAASTYNESNIKIYQIINGQPQLYNEPNLDADKGFSIINVETGNEKIRVFANYMIRQPKSEILIKFGNTQVDTINCEFSINEGSAFLEKVWYNGVLKSREFTIIK
ncbi:MAG: hypothetical protein V4541_05255 [Bacteroidota bacterium]